MIVVGGVQCLRAGCGFTWVLFRRLGANTDSLSMHRPDNSGGGDLIFLPFYRVTLPPTSVVKHSVINNAAYSAYFPSPGF